MVASGTSSASAMAVAASALATLWRPASGSAISASPCSVFNMKREPSTRCSRMSAVTSAGCSSA